ncbi:MAG: tetratricopeptide repeat protein [Polyangiaceae bacterium]|nr:tetratricopeptide repeat protein [Polyangiaceae bacterium]
MFRMAGLLRRVRAASEICRRLASRTAPLWIGIGIAGATGCASAPEVFGDKARFSPAFDAYVMAQPNGSDDPGVDDTVLLLRDPLTGNKLRCREDVLAWRELHEDIGAEAVHDDNVALGVGVATGAVFGPLLAMEPVGALLLAEALMTSEDLNDLLASADGTELLAAGITLYQRRRFSQASAVIERALAKDPSVGIVDKAYFYLGLSYREMGKKKRARLALTLFMDRAGVRDIDAYREAENALAEMGVQRSDCKSTEPVELYW